MKTSKRSFLVHAALVFSGAALLITPTAIAAQDTSTSSPANKGQTTKATKLSEKLTDRVAEYKTKQAVKLAVAEEAKLKGSCKAAQTKVQALGAKSDAAHTARTKVYDNITKRLSDITLRIKDAEVDTKELDAAIAEMSKRVTQYNDDYLAFKTNLADMSEIDCITDPTAFKAALLTARAGRATLVADATAIREYIPTVVKELATVKQALTKEDAAEEGGTQ